MDKTTLDAERAARLVRQHFHQPFSPEGIDDLLAVLRHVRLGAGETVLQQGNTDDDLFLVLSGRLQVRIEFGSGVAANVEEVGPGGVVGEMALLTGNARSATVTALEHADFAQLARADFERLAAKHPKALSEFLQRILPRLRRTQLIRALIDLFGELDAAGARGSGDASSNGCGSPAAPRSFARATAARMCTSWSMAGSRAVLIDTEGRTRILEEVGRGAAVGELALLTGEPRAATIIAVRDSDLLKLSRASFDALLDAPPAGDDADRARVGAAAAAQRPGTRARRGAECRSR